MLILLILFNVVMEGWTTGNWEGWNATQHGNTTTASEKTNSFLSGWYHRVKESYVAAWFRRVFQTGRMSSAPGGGGGSAGSGGGGAVGGALSLMGCVREASPPPQDHHPLSLGDFGMQRSVDTLPKGKFQFFFFCFLSIPIVENRKRLWKTLSDGKRK